MSNGNVVYVSRYVYAGCSVLPFTDEAVYPLSLSSAWGWGGGGGGLCMATDMERFFFLNFLQ